MSSNVNSLVNSITFLFLIMYKNNVMYSAVVHNKKYKITLYKEYAIFTYLFNTQYVVFTSQFNTI